MFFLCFLAGVLSAAEMRMWEDDRERKVEAAMVGSKDGVVILRLKNGKEMEFPIEKLSKADQEHVKEVLAKGDKQSGAGFDGRWPETVSFKDDPEVEIKSEDKEGNRYVYESANFCYVCDVKLASSVVRGFARLFEATYRYCMALPLAMGSEAKVDGKYQILLFEKEADYLSAGGLPGSAGVFMPSNGLIMVPLTSLGVRRVGNTYVLDRDKTNKTLPHEITHQVSPHAYFAPGAMGWFSEGIAEYVAVTPYTMGTYNVKMNLKAITEYVTAYGKGDKGGRNLGKKIHIPSLKEFFLQDYDKFRANGQYTYGVSLLLTYYFFHFDGDGDAKRIKSFLAALHDGRRGDEVLEVLLDGRSYDELEKEIAEKWGRKGVDFTFGG